MGSLPPAPWTYAARAGYFGDQVCSFCDRHNPVGAKFCNDCGSPLHLKPCNQCNAVNHQSATNCYECSAEFPGLFSAPEAALVLPAADPAWATADDVEVAATVPQPLFVARALRANWGLAAIATILIAGVYGAYRINAATPDAMEVASQPIGAGEHNAPTAASAVPVAMESMPGEPETTATVQAPIPITNPEAPKRASARQRPMTVPATKLASAHRRPGPVPTTKLASAHQRPVPVPATKLASAHQRPVPVPATKLASAPQRPVPERQARVGKTP